MAARSRRSEILTAYRQIVLDQGERAATLDAVARTAGVSKGGLLYHFPTKDALLRGLCARFAELVDDDLREMDASPYGPAEWYVRTSIDTSSELEATMSALVRLAPTDDALVRTELRSGRARWHERIVDELGDPQLAAVVVLLGDGIAYNSEIAGGRDIADPFTSTDTVEGALALIGRLHAN